MRFNEFKIIKENVNTYYIKQLQSDLKAAGADLGKFGPKGDGIDGKMGPLTQRAMLKFPEIAAEYKKTVNAASARKEFGVSDPRIKTGQNPNIDNTTRDKSREYVKKFMKNNDADNILPVDGSVKSPFGQRKSPMDGASTNHLGVDLAAQTGTPVRSPISGKVVYAKMDDGGCGGTIAIKNNNERHRFCHCSEIIVDVGQSVEQGDIVGLTGGGQDDPGRGTSTGPHLHWEKQSPVGQLVNPMANISESLGPDGSTGTGIKPSATKAGAPRTKDKAPETVNSIRVPTSRQGTEMRDVQQVLIALGYESPKDGARNPETIDAIKKFQKDNKLAIDGDPGPETIRVLNKLIASNDIEIKKSTLQDIQVGVGSNKTDISNTKKNSRAGAEPNNIDITSIKLQDLHPDAANAVARKKAEEFLGRELENNEWEYLLRSTGAEASNNTKEQGYVMAVILNRTRSGKWGQSVIDVLTAKNQFQAVTGTKVNGHRPSTNFIQGPQGKQLTSILTAAVSVLGTAPKGIMRFTAANRAAYGPGTNVAYLDKLQAAGGVLIGGTIFA
jgi:peptidoglycan hydrolase-like protein with peptidoglycan-binding domain/biotin carboxyl carrier protein